MLRIAIQPAFGSKVAILMIGASVIGSLPLKASASGTQIVGGCRGPDFIGIGSYYRQVQANMNSAWQAAFDEAEAEIEAETKVNIEEYYNSDINLSFPTIWVYSDPNWRGYARVFLQGNTITDCSVKFNPNNNGSHGLKVEAMLHELSHCVGLADCVNTGTEIMNEYACTVNAPCTELTPGAVTDWNYLYY